MWHFKNLSQHKTTALSWYWYLLWSLMLFVLPSISHLNTYTCAGFWMAQWMLSILIVDEEGAWCGMLKNTQSPWELTLGNVCWIILAKLLPSFWSMWTVKGNTADTTVGRCCASLTLCEQLISSSIQLLCRYYPVFDCCGLVCGAVNIRWIQQACITKVTIINRSHDDRLSPSGCWICFVSALVQACAWHTAEGDTVYKSWISSTTQTGTPTVMLWGFCDMKQMRWLFHMQFKQAGRGGAYNVRSVVGVRVKSGVV